MPNPKMSRSGVEIDSPVEPGPRQHGVVRRTWASQIDQRLRGPTGHDTAGSSSGGTPDEASPWRGGAHDDPGKSSPITTARRCRRLQAITIGQRAGRTLGLPSTVTKLGARNRDRIRRTIHTGLVFGERAEKQPARVEEREIPNRNEGARPT